MTSNNKYNFLTFWCMSRPQGLCTATSDHACSHTSSRNTYTLSLHTCCRGVAASDTCLRLIVVFSCSRIEVEMQPVTCMECSV